MKRIVLLLLVSFFLGSCNSAEEAALEALKETEDSTYSGAEIPKERIEELKGEVRKWKDTVDKKVEASGQLGNYYKLLGGAYREESMYGPALEAYQEAIRIFPENSILHFKAALSSAQLAVALPPGIERDQMLETSEAYYLMALERNRQYGEALYGLSVLYIFEMNRPLEAIPYVDELIMLEKNNMEALFLRARLYVLTGEVDKAIQVYSVIMEESKNQEKQDQARINRQVLLEQWNEG